MFAAERRNRIIEKLQTEKRVIVSQLSKSFGVSEETIRRDLDKLEKEGLIIKSYGGAVMNEDAGTEIPIKTRSSQKDTEKQKMAKIVASLVQDGDRIFLDADPTAVFVAKELKEKRGLTVLTNSIEVLLELADVSGWNLIATGGRLKEGSLAFEGAEAEEAIRSYCVDEVIFFCKALDQEWGIMEAQEGTAAMKKAVIKAGKKKTLVADITTFNQSEFFVIGKTQEIDTVVTNQKPSEEWLEYFHKVGVECKYTL